MIRFIHPMIAVIFGLAVALAVPPTAMSQQLFQTDPLIVAVNENKLDDVRALLVRGHNMEARDSDGRTALIWGATLGYYDAIALLLNDRSRPDLADNFGNTALYYAAGNGHLETVELLLDKGATIDAENLEGRSPLMRAVEASRVETSLLLMARGADINHADFTGRSVLDWAREGRSSRLVRVLEKAGAR